jgi:hypothetical protein
MRGAWWLLAHRGNEGWQSMEEVRQGTICIEVMPRHAVVSGQVLLKGGC